MKKHRNTRHTVLFYIFHIYIYFFFFFCMQNHPLFFLIPFISHCEISCVCGSISAHVKSSTDWSTAAEVFTSFGNTPRKWTRARSRMTGDEDRAKGKARVIPSLLIFARCDTFDTLASLPLFYMDVTSRKVQDISARSTGLSASPLAAAFSLDTFPRLPSRSCRSWRGNVEMRRSRK